MTATVIAMTATVITMTATVIAMTATVITMTAIIKYFQPKFIHFITYYMIGKLLIFSLK
jgi:hypothetical protein